LKVLLSLLFAGTSLLMEIPFLAAAALVTPAWRLDAEVQQERELPVRCRFLPEEQMSGSGQPATEELLALFRALEVKADGRPVYLVDLRQESHGYLFEEKHGIAVSWHTGMNAANRGQDAAFVEKDEEKRLARCVQSGALLTARPMGRMDISAGWQNSEIMPVSYRTERDSAEALGFHYVRIPATDMRWPEDFAVQDFLAFFRSLPEGAWVHFHCQAGVNRTTTFMAMYDILQHPEKALDEVLAAEQAAGGPDLRPRAELYFGLQIFQAYVREQKPLGFPLTYRAWKQQNGYRTI
jgi:hypothetical protein